MSKICVICDPENFEADSVGFICLKCQTASVKQCPVCKKENFFSLIYKEGIGSVPRYMCTQCFKDCSTVCNGVDGKKCGRLFCYVFVHPNNTVTYKHIDLCPSCSKKQKYQEASTHKCLISGCHNQTPLDYCKECYKTLRESGDIRAVRKYK